MVRRRWSITVSGARSRIAWANFNKRSGRTFRTTTFTANEALLRLSLLAFNLASMLRIEYEAAAGSCFDLGRFQREVLKAGGRVVKGAHGADAARGPSRDAPFWDRADRLPPALETSPPLSPATRGAGPRLDAAAPSRLPARGATLLAPRSDRKAPLQHDADDWGKGGGAPNFIAPTSSDRLPRTGSNDRTEG